MTASRYCTVAALALASTICHGADLTFGHIGVYAADFDFCSMSVIKVRYFGDHADASRLDRYRERLRENTRAGRPNIVGLYTFDRVKHSRSLEEYIAYTDAVLDVLDRGDMEAVFLAEENVTWNDGLSLLNGLYDHIKSRFPDLPVYQWLTAPMGPHPKLKADGWLYDYYKQGRASSRRKICAYVVTGKPLIMCLNASPDVSRFEAPLGGQVSQEQWEVCREFNLPVFYYCVDLRWGNPYIWWHSNDKVLTAWRNWLIDTVEVTNRTDVDLLPERSADYTDGMSIEGAPDEEGRFIWSETFASTAFLDHLSIRGFTNLRWDGMTERLAVYRGSKFRRHVDVFAHVESDFDMSSPSAELRLVPEGTLPGSVTLMLSSTGHNWPLSKTNENGEGVLSLDASGVEGFAGGPYWVRVSIDTGDELGAEPAATLDALRIGCAITPPDTPGVTLAADAEGQVRFTEDFASTKYRWLAHVTNGEAIMWRQGQLSLAGVKGHTNHADIRWPVSCESPLKDITVRMKTRANGKNLGAVNRLGVSLDGGDPVHVVSTRDLEADRHGWARGELVIDLSEDESFRGITHFWVHATMVNGSGIKTNPSNMINELVLTAETTKDSTPR